MTALAVVAQLKLHMVRVRRNYIVRLVTLIAIVVHQLVIAVCMTTLTLQWNMASGQREVRLRMTERCRTPVAGRMTLQTVVAEVA
jgi:hypothetical protein